MDKRLLRIIDANYNRAKEGLRVCEDICRFIYDNKSLTRSYKQARHDLTGFLGRLGSKDLVLARDIENDVGRDSIKTELTRGRISDIFDANSQRVKESIRVLEEVAKLNCHTIARDLKKLRYRVYGLEKKRILFDRQ